MISEDAAPLVIDLAKSLVTLVRQVEPKWSKVYLRVLVEESVAEAKVSYVHESGVEVVNVLRHKEFFHSATIEGRQLLAAIGKESGLFLLVVDSSLDYEIKFEHADMKRWEISKIDGGTGVPEGL